jgi:MFS family permease
VLFIQGRTDSFGAAGVVAGGFVLGNALGASAQGRLMDAYGVRRVLLPGSLAHAAGLGGVILLADLGAGSGFVVGAAVLAGATMPPISATLRSLLYRQLTERRDVLRSAYALDVVIVEVLFVFGPLATAVIVALTRPEWALVASMAAVVLGTAAFCRVQEPRAPGTAAVPQRGLGGLAVPGVRTAALLMASLGFCFGAIEVTLPAFAIAESVRAVGGVLIALLSVGSALGGLAYGARRAGSARRAVLVLASILPLAVAPLVVMPASAFVAAALVLLAGATIAPLTAACNELVGDVAHAVATTESYTWIFAAMTAGMTCGYAVTGQALDGASWRVGFAISVAGGVCTLLIALARRSTLGTWEPDAAEHGVISLSAHDERPV